MTQSPILLHDFQSQRPQHHAEQGVILEWIAAAHARAEITLRQPASDGEREEITRRLRKLVLRFGCSTDRISTRDSALGAFLERMGAGVGLGADHLARRALFAIHPGGPRIIDEIAELLGLGPEQVRASNAILRNHGNMSSATLPHVWKAMLEDAAVEPGRLIVALAFGPGLTISGAILRKRA
ncbi:MAG: 3-oxoacyl-[acyl-carrier-protein] synthase III C-terminal domain-containing protein [Holophaga sp.]|nr:3-oxoacyl-[acyl-carrier-protein] synthase III C-terminal domain-containing protein [Holophaga sp.]